MPRQNIFEILASKYNIEKEMHKIIELCNSYFFKNNYSCYTAEGLVDKYLLKKWKQRGSYLSCKEIRDDIGLYIKENNLSAVDTCILTLEYYINIIHLICNNLDIILGEHKLTHTDEFVFSIENSNILLKHLNHEKFVIKEEEKVILVPKNPVATAVAEISSENTALAIIKYNHATLKGDLEGKRNLLNSIYREHEPVFKSSIEGYNDFLKKTNGLFNTLHIRHNNTTNEDNKNTVINLDEKELEKWYDELYQLMLFCVLIKDNLKRKEEVDKFLKSIKGTKS